MALTFDGVAFRDSGPLLTPDEIMQLPRTDEIVVIAGTPPIRAKKARYFEDARLRDRIPPPPDLQRGSITRKSDDWSGLPVPPRPDIARAAAGVSSHGASSDDPAATGHRQQPELDEKQTNVKTPLLNDEFDPDQDDIIDADVARLSATNRDLVRAARQAALDPGYDMF